MYFVLLVKPEELPSRLPKQRLAGVTLAAGTSDGFTSFWDGRMQELVSFTEETFTHYPQLFKTARGLIGKMENLRERHNRNLIWLPCLWISPDCPEPFEKYLLMRNRLPGGMRN